MSYTSDLTLAQFQDIQPYLSVKKNRKPRKWSHHQILNGIFYILVTGAQWRNTPSDLPPWKTTYHYFTAWREQGVIDLVLKKCSKKIHENSGRRQISDTGYCGNM